MLCKGVPRSGGERPKNYMNADDKILVPGYFVNARIALRYLATLLALVGATEWGACFKAPIFSPEVKKCFLKSPGYFVRDHLIKSLLYRRCDTQQFTVVFFKKLLTIFSGRKFSASDMAEKLA